MSLPKAKRPVTCALCGISVNPLVARYLWVRFGWRGRGLPRPHEGRAWSLCGPCGEHLEDMTGPLLPVSKANPSPEQWQTSDE
jgi:hypothetical protein